MVYASPPAAAAPRDTFAINGVYRATSNGDWATSNDVYHDEKTVISTWTVKSTCSYPEVCEGSVTSDLGWTARLSTANGLWYVRRTVADWQPCPDGSSSDGAQTYTFYPVDVSGQVSVGSPTLAGQDTTIGRSGACGVNQWLAIRMPFTLTRVS
jgi:hypothetical protein